MRYRRGGEGERGGGEGGEGEGEREGRGVGGRERERRGVGEGEEERTMLLYYLLHTGKANTTWLKGLTKMDMPIHPRY